MLRLAQIMSMGLVALATLFMASSAAAQEAPGFNPAAEWNISGSNMARWEWYKVGGDKTASPYPSLGHQLYDQLDVAFDRQLDDFDFVRGNVSALWSNSKYRTNESGVFLERFSLMREKGDSAVPYRLQLGDYFGFYSQRTIQRGLKGIQVDIQPDMPSLGGIQSFQFQVGTGEASYNRLTPENDLYGGASWLSSYAGGALSANIVHHRKGGDDAFNAPSFYQTVYSLAFNRAFGIGEQKLNFDGEFALLGGEVGPNSGWKDDTGVFLQTRGSSRIPLTYSVRFEEYGKDFRPAGSVVSNDRRTLDGRAGWRFARGLSLQGRAQHFRDALHSDNPVTTEVLGLNLTGPALGSLVTGMNVALDGFLRQRKSHDRVTDISGNTLSLNVSAPLAEGWSGRINLVRTDEQRLTQQANAEITRGFEMGRYSGSAFGGLSFRRAEGQGRKTDDIGGNLGFDLRWDEHRVAARWQRLFQDFRTPSALDDVDTNTIVASYDFSRGRHNLRAEGEVNNRVPSPGREVRGWKAGLTYTLYFEKPARSLVAKAPGLAPRPETAPVFRAASAAAAGAPVPPLPVPALTGLLPGTPIGQVRQSLADSGLGPGIDLAPGIVVYEARVYPEIDQRQRLVLLHDAQSLQNGVVLIDFDAAGGLDTPGQIYESVRRTLIRQHGTPAISFDRGSFSQNLAADIASEQLVRLSQWRVGENVLRLGIPRRLDRQVRIEIQFAALHPPPRDTNWSIDAVH